MIFVGKLFGEIDDVENYLTYQARRERYVLGQEFFDTGLNEFKL